MPNHITTIIHIEARYSDDEQGDYDTQEAKLKQLWKDLHTDQSDFDFNAILPQPKDIYRGNLSAQDHIDHPVNWYDWNTSNWGTKWNAYSVHYLDNYKDGEDIYGDILVKIETAWSPPMPVLEELANRFRIRYTWTDEGDGTWHGWDEIEADTLVITATSPDLDDNTESGENANE